jgi:hypothetical protein
MDGEPGQPRSGLDSAIVFRRSSHGRCRAQVVLAGFDVRNILEADPVASVTIEAPDDAKELARFLGMCVVAMLRNGVHTPGITEPFAKYGWIVSNELAEAPPDADLAQFSIAARVRPEDVVEFLEHEMVSADVKGRSDPSLESMLTVKFPRVSNESRKGKKRRLRAVLHEGKKPFVALHSRNAMIAADGVLCILEQIAHERPRDVTRHTAAVCRRLVEIHRDLSGERIPLSFDQATAMYRITEAVARADDPSTFVPDWLTIPSR